MTLDEAIQHCKEVAKENRKTALEYARAYAWDTSHGCRECANEHEQLAAWLVELKESRECTRWIPCSERLPEKDTDVIVCCYGSDMILAHDGETMQDAIERTCRECARVTIGFIGSDGWYGADWFPMMVSPTYWMPLPETPKGGAEDE